jgi:hypothetical protein
VRSDSKRHLAAAVLAIAVAAATAVTAQEPEARPPLPTDAEIVSAVQAVKGDPNLATERTVKMLRWKNGSQPPATRPAWLAWVAGLVRWFEESARALVWVVVAILIAVLGAFIVRVLQSRGAPTPDVGVMAPTHVRNLDIRPETLPADIGAAARQLWDRGDHRAALALLYRGLLSRLAHAHQVPIRDSTTEGDCLILAARHLPPRPRDYAARLIPVWQQAVYGHAAAPTPLVHALCDDFIAIDTAGPESAA